jgi:RNA polymerase sporulation-specific sigma factor
MERQAVSLLAACTDSQLSSFVKSGSSDAFAELTSRYLELVRVKSAPFRGTFLDNDDLCQEGLCGLYHAACTYHKEKGVSFSSYAGVCIHNCVIIAYRKAMNARRRPPNGFVSISEENQLSSPESEEPEALMLAKERLHNMQKLMQNHLTQMEQQVLMLYLSGCSYAEIAQRMCITPKAADNALQRARQKLKKQP